MKRNLLFGFAFALLSSLPVSAYDSERAVNNIAHEFAECGAYFSLVANAPGLDPSTKKALAEQGNLALSLSVDLTSEKLTLARLDLALQGMKRDLESSWANLSIAHAKYGYTCRDMLNDPGARMKYWLEKKD